MWINFEWEEYDFIFTPQKQRECFSNEKVTIDDVINMTKFLKTFDGDFINYFIRRSNEKRSK